MAKLPKITKDHQYNSDIESLDYFLEGNHFKSIHDILFYSIQQQTIVQADIKNNLQDTRLSWLELGDQYYIEKTIDNNSCLSALFTVISPTFALIKNTQNKAVFISNIRKNLGIELVEGGLYKGLNCKIHKLKRKELEAQIFLDPKYENLDSNPENVLKYIGLRFHIGILLIYSKDRYQFLTEPVKRKYAVLIKTDEKHWSVLCNKSEIANLFDRQWLDINIINKINKSINLKSIKEYKIADLRELCEKMNITLDSKLNKNEIYKLLENKINNKL